MEVAVAEFVSHTGSEPGLARDILQSTNWDIHAAYNVFNTLRSDSRATGREINAYKEIDAGEHQLQRLKVDVGEHQLQRLKNLRQKEIEDPLEKDFRFPLPSLHDHESSSLKEFLDEEANGGGGRVSSPHDDAPPSPVGNDLRCIDCIKADNLVNEHAQSNQDWIISDCPHIEGFHPGNLITPPSSYNGSYCDDFLRNRKHHLSQHPQQQLQRQQQQQPFKLSSNSSSFRIADFDAVKAVKSVTLDVVSSAGYPGSDKVYLKTSPSADRRFNDDKIPQLGQSLRRPSNHSPIVPVCVSPPVNIIITEVADNPFDPDAAGGSKAHFKPEVGSGDESPTEGKYGSAPCVSGFRAMSGGTCFSSSAAAPLPDAAIDSPVSDGDAEKAAPVVEQLNGTLTRKFARGISAIADNRPLVFQARFQVMRDIQEDEASNSQYFVETPHYSFMLPDLRSYPVDFQQFLRKDLVETSSLVSLEHAGRLNWWVEKGAGRTLLPLATSGDGNCLLHAASLGMWGFHDRLLTLRKALHHTLTASTCKGALWRRWRWHQTLQNKQVSLVYSDAIWEEEWNGLVKLSSTTPRSKPESSSSSANKGTSPKLMGGGSSAATSLTVSGVHNTSSSSNAVVAAANCADSIAAASEGAVVDSGAAKGVAMSAENGDTVNGGNTTTTTTNENDSTFYESLEEFHVFVLAHVLRRPIIVVADTMLKDSNGDPFQPIHFGGVYLPLECSPSSCKRSPLVLSYDAAHFSAVVAMEGHAPHDPADENRKLLPVVVPVVAPDFNLLSLHFAVDPGEDFDWEKETKNPKIAKKLVVSTNSKLDLLLKYLDIVTIPLPKATKTATLNRKTLNTGVTKQAESEKFVSNSIWGNDEKSAYGLVDFDSSIYRNDKQALQLNGFDEPDHIHFETSPSTTSSTSHAVVEDLRRVNPGHDPTTSSSSLPAVFPHRHSSSSSSSSTTSSNQPRSNALVTGLGSIGRSVTKKLRRNFGGIIGNGKKTATITTTTTRTTLNGVDDDSKWADIATVDRVGGNSTPSSRISGDEIDGISRKQQQQSDRENRGHWRKSSSEKKLPSSVFGCAQVPDDVDSHHSNDSFYGAEGGGVNGTGVGGRRVIKNENVDGPGRAVNLEEKAEKVELRSAMSSSSSSTTTTTSSPRRHRRLLSSDVNSDRQMFNGAKNGSGAKTLPKTSSSTPGGDSRNRKYGVALRNPFSTLERQKNKGEVKASAAPTLAANMIGDPNFLIAAKFCTNKRHEYQNEMLQNYLQNVRERFEEDKRSKNGGGNGGGDGTVKKAGGEEPNPTCHVNSSAQQPQQQQRTDSPQQQQQQHQHQPNSPFSSPAGDQTTKPASSRLESSTSPSTSSTAAKPPSCSSFSSYAAKPPPCSSSSGGNRHPCISNGCSLYGSSASSYLCNTCFAKAKEEAVSVEKDLQLRGSNSRLNSPVKRQPVSTASTTASTTSGPKRAGSSGNLLAVRNSQNNAAFSSLPRRK